MERVSLDLDRSKKMREKQALEFHKQLETEKFKHEREVTDLVEITAKINHSEFKFIQKHTCT